MTFPLYVLLNWVPNPIWFSRKGYRHLSPFTWEKICWYGLCIRMNQCLQHIPFWCPLIPQDFSLFFKCFELTLVLRENITSASGNAVATWSGQMHKWFCEVTYIILISAESTAPTLFIPLFSPPIILITITKWKKNITALIIIILSDTWNDFHILLVVVDSSWNTRIWLWY